MDLKGKNAIITGGAKGIGAMCSQDMLKAGVAKLAILDMNQAAGQETANKLGAEHGKDRVKFVKCDVTNKSEFESAVKTVAAEFKKLDIFINNAGILNEAMWEKEILINLNSVIFGTKLAMDIMSKEKGGNGGTIVNTASILGLAPLGGCPVYVATKHAVIGFTRSWAMPHNVKKTGIRMMVMCPGVTKTDLFSGDGKGHVDEEKRSDCLKELMALPNQSVDNVGQGMMHLLKHGSNGSVWVSEGGKPAYEIQMPERQEMKKN